MLLDDKKLKEISGGSSLGTFGISTIIGGIVTFIVGIFSGYMNPISCNK